MIAAMLVIGIGGVIPSVVSADGGLVTLSVTSSAPVTITPKLTNAQQISRLQTLVKLYATVQALQLVLPTSLASDEGLLPVVVNDAMRFPCAGKAGMNGQWCVRSLGDLGESHIDLDTIVGFPYDERFAYELTLFRTRNVESGDTNAVPYQYFLLAINNLSYQK